MNDYIYSEQLYTPYWANSPTPLGIALPEAFVQATVQKTGLGASPVVPLLTGVLLLLLAKKMA